MQRAAVLAAAVLLGLTAGVSAWSRQSGSTPTQASGTAVLAGQVVDQATQRPLGGVVVTLMMTTAPARAGGPSGNVRRAGAVTSNDGRFVFRDLPAGTFTLTSTLNGYHPGASGQARPAGPSRPLVVADGSRVTDVLVPMWRLSTVSGVVRDDRGDPLVGAYIRAMRRSLTSGQSELIYAGGGGEATDEQGRFRIAGLAPGTYAIVLTASTQSNPASTVRQILQARAAAGPGTVGIGVTREGRESGAVQIERTGIDVNGWQASVSIGSTQPLPGPEGTLLLHPTTYYPGVTDVNAATFVTVAPGVDRAGVDFTVPFVKTVRVSGVIVGPDGPAARNAIRLLPQPGGMSALPAGGTVATGTADDQGRFVLLGVPPGTYVLDAYRAPLTAAGARMLSSMTGEKIEAPANPPPGVHARVPITVGTDHVDNVVVSMRTRGSVSGRITFNGTATIPAGDNARLVSIALLNVQSSNRIEAKMTPDHTFEITDVPPGRYHLVGDSLAREWKFAGAQSTESTLASGALDIAHETVSDVVVSFTDKGMSVSGSVMDESGRPATDGSVVVFPVDVKAWIAAGTAAVWTNVARVASDGSFQMTVALPGEYIIVAAPADVQPQATLHPIPITTDPEFAMAYAPLGTRMSIALGESKTQALTIRRAR